MNTSKHCKFENTFFKKIKQERMPQNVFFYCCCFLQDKLNTRILVKFNYLNHKYVLELAILYILQVINMEDLK